MQNTEFNLKCQMEGIPQLMSLDIPGLTQERLLSLLENLEDEVDADDVCLEETIFKLNMKTWVCIKLAHYAKAEKINARVITMTQWENVISIGNCMFLRWRSGRQEEALNCSSKLQAMKQLPSSADSLATAKAELAYCYSRVGGPVNLFNAIRLFEDIIGSNADKLYWKLRLGLAYRRCTHLNIYTGMPEGRTIQECVEKAAKYLTDVYRDDSAGKLRGPALSELAVLNRTAAYIIQRNDIGRIFGMQTPIGMCNEALELGHNSTWVLTNCGKLLRTLKQLDRAAAVLESCLLLRKHTTTHHQLGLCYAWMAEAASRTQNPRTQQRPARGRQPYPARDRDYRYPPANRPLITLPNENFNRAERQYLEAIQLSHDRNLPAVYDLGLLYKLAGRYQDAVNRFNQVTMYGGEGNLLTMINAYEQAGLCYLLTNNPEAEGKLTKAINLAVVVASTCPQLENCATEIWRSFRTMQDRLEAESPSPSRDKKLLRLYELVKNHRGVVNFLEKVFTLSDSQLEDPEVITVGLRGYLELHETEKAFAFLNMVSIGPNIANSRIWETPDMINLRREVLLSTAEDRLEHQSTDAKFVFQELFKLHYGQCTGSVSEDSVCISNSRDVLLFYDEEHDTEELSQISQTAQALQRVLSQVFGLDTSRNLQGSLKYGPKMDKQLEEMRKYQVVVVVLGEEIRSPEFKAMMAMIPNMAKTVSSSRKVLVIDACQQATQVPEILGHYQCLRLQQTVGTWSQRVALALGGDDYSRARDNIRKFVGDNVPDVLVLPFLWNKLDRSTEGSCCMGNTWSLN